MTNEPTTLFNNLKGATRVVRDYLILFVASSIARSRPNLWSSTLRGETNDKVVFTLATRNALLGYTRFDINNSSYFTSNKQARAITNE